MTRCYLCKREHTNQNSATRKSPSGNIIFKSRCRECDKKYMKNYNKKWYPKNKDKKREQTYKWRKENPEKDTVIQRRMTKKYRVMHQELKVNGCAICGYNKCIRSLDFHHVNPEDKKFEMHSGSMGSLTWKDFADELNKCILLCRNCHGEITDLEKESCL